MSQLSFFDKVLELGLRECLIFDIFGAPQGCRKQSPVVSLRKEGRDFPGGPVVKTSSFQCRRHRLNFWWGN